jgi:hypothetical protein
MTFRELRLVLDDVPDTLLDVLVPFKVPMHNNHPEYLDCVSYALTVDSNIVPPGTPVFFLEGAEEDDSAAFIEESSNNVTPIRRPECQN